MAKSCPTLSSVDILRSVFSAHFLPFRSRWMGPDCRKRSLVLSLSLYLARERGAAISRTMKKSFRSMLHDDNKLGHSCVRRQSAVGALSVRVNLDFFFDCGNGFAPDRRVIANAGQPMDVPL